MGVRRNQGQGVGILGGWGEGPAQKRQDGWKLGKAGEKEGSRRRGKKRIKIPSPRSLEEESWEHVRIRKRGPENIEQKRGLEEQAGKVRERRGDPSSKKGWPKFTMKRWRRGLPQ